MAKYKVGEERVISPQQAANKCLAVVVKFREGARAYLPIHYADLKVPPQPGIRHPSVVREFPIGFKAVASHHGCPDTWETVVDWVEYHANRGRTCGTTHVLLCCDTAEELMAEILKEMKCRS